MASRVYRVIRPVLTFDVDFAREHIAPAAPRPAQARSALSRSLCDRYRPLIWRAEAAAASTLRAA